MVCDLREDEDLLVLTQVRPLLTEWMGSMRIALQGVWIQNYQLPGSIWNCCITMQTFPSNQVQGRVLPVEPPSGRAPLGTCFFLPSFYLSTQLLSKFLLSVARSRVLTVEPGSTRTWDQRSEPETFMMLTCKWGKWTCSITTQLFNCTCTKSFKDYQLQGGGGRKGQCILSRRIMKTFKGSKNGQIEAIGAG